MSKKYDQILIESSKQILDELVFGGGVGNPIKGKNLLGKTTRTAAAVGKHIYNKFKHAGKFTKGAVIATGLAGGAALATKIKKMRCQSKCKEQFKKDETKKQECINRC